ncbi:integrase arm-type DNA-binding domain-containing protein [Bradyrhizobium septentrionale]|uniref:Integrase arm-type DNA-binding domain-containing protein n=1 Tax=Bradyrhizobium septentrionale TaxID=1404411 RepID=A0A973W9B6_9BRAD|nr:integrase arm-type DNA-binding domain-containing protein [Bradyrhizobium septentrionale]UGY18614.1 integrase arm-type DNA-binding domain-containing protein [Bradyrhizobium septentrionale]
MAGAKLTDKAIKHAKPGEKLAILSDGGGLQLWLTPTGGKLWNYAYRFGGKRKRLAIGPYGKDPAGVPLEAARKRRDEAAGLVRDGVDPATRKRQVKAARAEAHSNAFSVIAAELFAKKQREGVAAATAGKLEWLLGLAKADLGSLPIADISAGEILRVLQPLEAAGKLETAKRLRATIGAVFRHAVATARADNDPTLALRGAIASPKPQHRAAITDPKAFGGLLRAIEGFMGQPTTKAALQLIALLACRPGELRHATWREFDLDGCAWEVPAQRTKMRRPHRIPLSTQAVAILKTLHPITGHGAAGLVFPGLRSVKRPISENTLNGALRRIGFSQDEASAHGFRSTFSTLANESGRWSVNGIEAALAHIEPNAVRRAYARGDYWDERVKMMQWWADYCDTLRQGGRVVEFKAASV